MRGRLRICNAFYFSFCKGRKKKENLEIQTYIISKRKWYKVEKNITEIFSFLLLAISFFFTYNVIFIVGVGCLRCLLFFFLVHVTRGNNMKSYYVLLRWKWPISKTSWQVILIKYLKKSTWNSLLLHRINYKEYLSSITNIIN